MSANKLTPVRQLTMVELKDGNKGVKLKWTETFVSKKTDGTEFTWVNKHSVDCPRRPHADLINAMRSLRKMMIDLDGWELKDFKQYDVTKLELIDMEMDETAKVIIYGHKTVARSGDPVPVETPPTSLFNKDEYFDCDKLDDGCKRVTDQVWEYVFNGKYEPDPQLELPLQDGGNMKIS